MSSSSHGQANHSYSVDEALDALSELIARTPTVALSGTLTSYRPGRRWANGELVGHSPDHSTVAAKLRLSFPPGSLPKKGEVVAGAHVRVHGRFIVDKLFGPVQFRVNTIETVQLRAASTVQVAELAASIRHEGLDKTQKRLVLPADSATLAVICPRGTGAGGHDFLTRLNTSDYPWNLTPIEIPMGGPAAAAIIAEAITTAGKRHYQALVVCRGGGAASDMAPFDSEEVAKAIVQCPVPVVVAVGHATDTHIADTVAYATLATPSAAAEWFNQRRDQDRQAALEFAARTQAAIATAERQDAARATRHAEAATLAASTSALRARTAIAIAVAVVLVAAITLIAVLL